MRRSSESARSTGLTTPHHRQSKAENRIICPGFRASPSETPAITVLQFNSMKAPEIYRRFIGRSAGNNSRAGDAYGASYAKPANAASDAAFHEVLSFRRGDVVQLVRTLPSCSPPFFSYV